ncbi:MAG: ParB/RepB/Spo0J family partition protein [Pseudoruegeria sp.]
MSKRRMFDIDFPEVAVPQPPVPAGTDTPKTGEGRRGPMAAAITENADALRERAEAEQAIREENDRLAHEHVRLKKLGLVTDLIDINDIKTSKLTRDRSGATDPELDELKASIQSIGLSNPIRVEVDGDGYQLVQGFRRLSAYRVLYAETGDDRYARIPAGLIAPGEGLDGLYRRMVDENLVRKDLSFAEMAQLAMAYAADQEVTVEEAVATLYASAGRQKRAYIRNFASLLGLIGPRLKFPEAISRALGLQLEKRLAQEEGAIAKLRSALTAAMPATVDAELSVLRNHAVDQGNVAKTSKPAAPTAKTTLRCAVPAGTVRCSARNGKIELAMERDFSSVDRHRLEQAVVAFMAALDD